jgi:ABC-type glycerol-3-phosphate transport system substrate-binding protein
MSMKNVRAIAVALMVLAVAVGASAADKVQLSYWSMWGAGENQAKVIQGWITAFEAANPNITITPTWNGRQNQTLLRTALQGGTKVDFMDQDADQVAGGLMNAGMGYPLNDFLKGKAADGTGTVESLFVPGVVHMFDKGGKTYLVPYIYNTCQFFYDQGLFDRLKIANPRTWDDFLNVCETVKKDGKAALSIEGDQAGYNSVYFTYLIARLKGPGWMTKAANDKTGAMWKDPAVLKAAQMARGLWTKGYVPSESKGYKWPQGQQNLAAGDTAMECVGSWYPTELASAVGPDWKWGGFPFPEVKGGSGSSGDMMAFILSFMVLKDTPHPKEALQFLNFIMSKENQQAMVKNGIVGVTRKGVDWPVALQGAQKAAETAKAVFGEGDGLAAANPELWVNVIRNPFQDMFVGNSTPEQFAAKLVPGTQDYWKNKK